MDTPRTVVALGCTRFFSELTSSLRCALGPSHGRPQVKFNASVVLQSERPPTLVYKDERAQFWRV